MMRFNHFTDVPYALYVRGVRRHLDGEHEAMEQLHDQWIKLADQKRLGLLSLSPSPELTVLS